MGKLINQKFLKIIDKINNRKTEKKNLKILDWGCSKGDLVKFLNDHGYDCYGLEVEDNIKVKDELKIYDDDFFKKKFLT